ncbi:MAG: Na/Pi cotransporter family protein, partial [Clostridia bacterium]|nr:Na/Pi cotransporter family protein [Clostridia bacterium]
EQVIDGLIDEIRARHIARLQKGNCTVEMGFVLADLLNNYERVSDHCSNLGVITIEAEGKEKAGAHAYLNEVKDSNSFNEVFEKYRAEYSL